MYTSPLSTLISSLSLNHHLYYYYYLFRIKMQHKKTHIIRIQHTSKTNKKGEIQSADKTTIKAKVHVYVSTTVLANDIQILRFISYRDSERELMPYLEATASCMLMTHNFSCLFAHLTLTHLLLIFKMLCNTYPLG